MGLILGVDVGGSTTKIVGFTADNRLTGVLLVKAADQVTSMYGSIGHFLRQHKLPLKEVDKIVLTGVGASFIVEDVYDIPTAKVDEFRAIGYGGLYLAGMEEAFVASMGTGTAFVRASRDEIVHIGGSGVGGGTLIGLASKLLHTEDIGVIISLAEKGRLEHVDLFVRDILDHDIPSLPPNLTAANFGKVNAKAADADYAYGIINMIFQTIGMLAAFATRNDEIKDVILTGNLAALPQAKVIFGDIARMYGVHFIIPDHAIYATAIGAACLN